MRQVAKRYGLLKKQMRFQLIFFLILTFDANSQLSVDVARKECDKSMMPFVGITRDHLTSMKIENNQLKLSLGLVENCEMNFLFQAKLSNSLDTLLLQYSNQPRIINKGYPVQITEEIIAMCDCYFEVDLIIDSVVNLPTVILIVNPDYPFKEIVQEYQRLYFLEQNGLPCIPEKFRKKSKKYNQQDLKGNKIGIWTYEIKDFKVYDNYIQSNNSKTRPYWRVGFDNFGNQKFAIIYDSKGVENELSYIDLKQIQAKIETIKKNNKP
jgi:hypothetical protein